jgi:hypothetical protein
MAITDHERIGKALERLKPGLQPFVERDGQAGSLHWSLDTFAYSDYCDASADRYPGP